MQSIIFLYRFIERRKAWNCINFSVFCLPLLVWLVPYALFFCAIISAITAKDAGVVSKGDFSYWRLSFWVVNLSHRFGRTGIYTRTTADTGIKAKLRFASIPFRHHARLPAGNQMVNRGAKTAVTASFNSPNFSKRNFKLLSYYFSYRRVHGARSENILSNFFILALSASSAVNPFSLLRICQ